MPETDIHVEIASIKTTMQHMERQVSVAHAAQVALGDRIETLLERLVRVEERGENFRGVAGEAHLNSTNNAIHDAVDKERKILLDSVRRTIFGSIAGVGTFFAIFAIFIK